MESNGRIRLKFSLILTSFLSVYGISIINFHFLFVEKENVRPVVISCNELHINKEKRIRFNCSNGA